MNLLTPLKLLIPILFSLSTFPPSQADEPPPTKEELQALFDETTERIKEIFEPHGIRVIPPRGDHEIDPRSFKFVVRDLNPLLDSLEALAPQFAANGLENVILSTNHRSGLGFDKESLHFNLVFSSEDERDGVLRVLEWLPSFRKVCTNSKLSSGYRDMKARSERELEMQNETLSAIVGAGEKVCSQNLDVWLSGSSDTRVDSNGLVVRFQSSSETEHRKEKQHLESIALLLEHGFDKRIENLLGRNWILVLDGVARVLTDKILKDHFAPNACVERAKIAMDYLQNKKTQFEEQLWGPTLGIRLGIDHAGGARLQGSGHQLAFFLIDIFPMTAQEVKTFKLAVDSVSELNRVYEKTSFHFYYRINNKETDQVVTKLLRPEVVASLEGRFDVIVFNSDASRKDITESGFAILDLGVQNYDDQPTAAEAIRFIDTLVQDGN